MVDAWPDDSEIGCDNYGPEYVQEPALPPPHCGDCDICRADYSDAIREQGLASLICERLGLDVNNVAEIHLAVGRLIQVRMHDVDANGRKYVNLPGVEGHDQRRIGMLAETVHHLKIVALS